MGESQRRSSPNFGSSSLTGLPIYPLPPLPPCHARGAHHMGRLQFALKLLPLVAILPVKIQQDGHGTSTVARHNLQQQQQQRQQQQPPRG
jgi:hypothetical protein